MKEIKLTQGKVALVDDEDYDYLNQWKWCAHKYPNTYYADRQGYFNNKKTTIKMHRIIIETPSDLNIDHINHNGLDNRKSNLRICTDQQNCMNSLPFGNIKYKGVSILYKSKKGYKYEANIRFNRIKRRIGIYNDPIEAALAYDREARILFGEFAYLNFSNFQ